MGKVEIEELLSSGKWECILKNDDTLTIFYLSNAKKGVRYNKDIHHEFNYLANWINGNCFFIIEQEQYNLISIDMNSMTLRNSNSGLEIVFKRKEIGPGYPLPGIKS